MKRLRIVADENIPYVSSLFGSVGDITTVPGRDICPKHTRDADILLVRSVTQVGRALIEGSPIRFVGTCTIGTDHLDMEALDQAGITVASAPGCNANAVVQYVVCALARCERLSSPASVVIVGAGNVGRRVARALSALEFECRCVDPFLDEGVISEHGLQMAELDAVAGADIVCLHTPLTRSGPHPTESMMNAELIHRLKPGALLLNAGRGGVIDNHALLDALERGQDLETVLDVWGREPDLSVPLLQRVAIGTPHIAGYSLEGRVTGSLMIYDALLTFLDANTAELRQQRARVVQEAFGDPVAMPFQGLAETVLKVYDCAADGGALRDAIPALPNSFDHLRKHYPMRREFSHYSLSGVPSELKNLLGTLRFQV